jgi:hypothetical protein
MGIEMQRSEDNGEQFAHERSLARRAELNDFATQSGKAASFLNGGGAVAMLGLLQALVQKTGQFHAFKRPALLALVVFTFGAMASGLLFFARWQQAHWADQESAFAVRRVRLYWWIIVYLMALPYVTFSIGCLLATFGIMRI